ncbi:hypothetical protein BDA99DRAFT_473273 [Phascolomyces articulosus]|uniref:Uncharacterized protein n=1 Tax=Phascolomyces articulosus TaxID=60185 RepID=A0AAD5KPH5_9FUNG|nr:hypothetical protein BDA99DRAFT_473273 [Phascolomyces articulosus]
MNITEGQALCMLFSMECTEENISLLTKKLESYEELLLCYETHPLNPVLVTKSRVFSLPYTFKRYLIESPTANHATNEVKLSSGTHVVQFINAAFCANEVPNNPAYTQEDITSKDIFTSILPYTDIFDEKTVLGFSQWCVKNKPGFITLPVTRKRKHGVNARTRQLYVLKKEYLANLAKNIVMFLPNHQNYIKQLKEEGYEIVGYARKSPGEQPNRLANLTAMVNKLKERSFVDKCFISRVSNASDELGERDLRDTSTSNIPGTHGNTQDMIGHIASSNKKICLVVIDYAGFSTNQQNIYDFVHNHKALEKIIIDQIPYYNQTTCFTRSQILDDISVLSVFDCRMKTLQRSKA